MPMHESIDGVVVRVQDKGSLDRYLSVLTASRGRISMLAKGSRSMKGTQMGVSQLYTYGNFEYYRRGDFNILKGGSVHEHFYSLSMDIDRMNLAAYLCDVTCEVTDEGEEASDVLRLLLNSLYAISHDRYAQETVKGAFEWRIAALSGYEPEMSGCALCGAECSDLMYLDVMNGALLCSDCMKKRGNVGKRAGDFDDIREADVLCPLSPAALAALQYCLAAPLERLFSFGLKSEEDRRAFSKAAQTYLLSHLGRGFDSLNFYLTLRDSVVPAKGKKL